MIESHAWIKICKNKQDIPGHLNTCAVYWSPTKLIIWHGRDKQRYLILQREAINCAKQIWYKLKKELSITEKWHIQQWNRNYLH